MLSKKIIHNKYNYNIAGMFTILCIVILLFIHNKIVKVHTNELQIKASERIKLYKNSLHNELGRFSFLPFVISKNKQLVSLALKQDKKANITLESIKNASGANVIYIMDLDGSTLSSSNWESKYSFINHNFSFRPYFKQALKDGNGQFFGVGTTTKKPGFYIAASIKYNNINIGVTVVKVDLSVLEHEWIKGGENIFVTNKEGIVIMGSQKQMKYRATRPLSQQQITSIKRQKQFPNKEISSLFTKGVHKQNEVKIDKKIYLQQKLAVNNKKWTIHYLTPKSELNKLINSTWIKTSLIISAILVIFLLIWSLKYRNKLKISIQESDKLKKLNNLLKTEIHSREIIENELLIAQENIKRTSKLVAMGQLSASVIHELGQPLSAMKTYIASAFLPQKNNNDKEHILNILPKLDSLVDRMHQTSKQLKFLSYNNKSQIKTVDIRDILTGALVVVQPALEKDKVELLLKFKQVPYIIEADRVRMEQVFINLINNARFAVKKSHIKKISIYIKTADEQIIITVKDTGTGIPTETLKMLFNPFYTTKPYGAGLGLGLTISTNIINEFNGTINAINNKEVGASFVINLPLYKKL